MTLLGLPGRFAHALRHPRTTVRWRLTLLYTTLFLASGAALLVITYGLVSHATSRVSPGYVLAHHPELRLPHPRAHPGLVHGQRPAPAVVARLLHSHAGRAVVGLVGRQQRVVDLHQLVIEAVIALALMALLSAALGWIVAGRVLAPLRTMTARTRSISEDNLHARLALSGPPDELRQLADTIDALLARLEGAFDAQRRFVANASHELRTPLTAMRALLEMVLTDPAADVESFRRACEQVLQESADQEHLIDALLMLARGQRGLDHREPLELAAIAADVLMAHELEAAARGVRVHSELAAAPIVGEGRLVARLVANLVDNAIRHNVPDGCVEVTVGLDAAQPTLTVRNSGPQVPADEVDRLLVPFQRLGAERVRASPAAPGTVAHVEHTAGLGLGLSIVAVIAGAHDAQLRLDPQPSGGLVAEVRFPAAEVAATVTTPR